MSSARAAIDAHVRAKDENRPYLARRAFAEDPPHLATALTIKIEHMPTFAPRRSPT